MLATGPPGQQMFPIDRKQMKGWVAVLMSTYYVSGLQQPLFYRLREVVICPRSHS